ncbi:MAG: DUF4922 domain-containing protein [Bacteroidetes bacterium]|nr:DUF4922 domain-containing protein [Bacteroidota bacterium]
MAPQTLFARFPEHDTHPLHVLTHRLYEAQQRQWPMLQDGVEALKNVRVRTVDCNGFSVRLQFNPKRIVSTGAKVDAAAIRERKCFLCSAHLPAEQQGILVREKFLILCNPMPIFPEHFTIAHVDHIPQSIEESILTFLTMAKELSPRYSVFYNGPKCGASAPDHLHFQASPFGAIPAEKELPSYLRQMKESGGVTVSSAEGYGRSVLVLSGNGEQQMELAFLRLTSAMRRVTGTNDEPMMNVLGSYADGRWTVTVFLRSKHRPDVYFREGEEKVLISPASVDIGGLVVTPMEKDFLRADSSMIESIFHEISIPQDAVQRIVEAL